MREQQLVDQVLPRLVRMAEHYEFQTIRRVVLQVGVSNTIDRQLLVQTFLQAFLNTPFAGAAIDIIELRPNDPITGADGKPARARGTEIIVARIDGE